MAKSADTIHKVPCRTNYKFTNWAGTYSCQPELYFEPESIEDVQAVVAEARRQNKHVKVVGCGHSPSDLACTSDYMVNLCRMNKLLEVDKERCLITIEGGVVMEDLNKLLEKEGLALSVLGSVSDQTMTGSFAVGTHGTGAKFAVCSDYIRELDMVLASGEVLKVSKEKDPETFLAVVLSLGAIGIIVAVTLKCEPVFRLKQVETSMSLDDVLSSLSDHLASSEHFRFLWRPHTEKCTVYHASRTDDPMKNADGSWLWDKLVGYHALQFMLWIGSAIRPAVPMASRLYAYLNSQRFEKVDKGVNIFNFDCLFSQFVMEWAIPVEETATVLLELKAWLEKSGFPAHFPVEVRFVKGDDMYLSPAFGRDSCYINIVSYCPYGKVLPHEAYWNAFQDIVLKVGGRPHWAKDHKITAAEFSSMYPKWNDFCRIRQQLDPNGMFLNDNLKRVFGSKL